MVITLTHTNFLNSLNFLELPISESWVYLHSFVNFDSLDIRGRYDTVFTCDLLSSSDVIFFFTKFEDQNCFAFIYFNLAWVFFLFHMLVIISDSIRCLLENTSVFSCLTMITRWLRFNKELKCAIEEYFNIDYSQNKYVLP